MPAPGSAPTLLIRFYAVVTRGLRPVVLRKVGARLMAQGVSETRVGERDGRATMARPDGPVIWFHAASVGESLSVLSLIARLGVRLPGHEFVITSGTATSAALIDKRMPPRARHQFAPLDAPGPVARFYDHWQPCAAIFVESELWPLLLLEGPRRGVRMALVNARLSERSVEGWRKRPRTARCLLDVFDLMLTQDRRTGDNLRAIGADPARVEAGANLKALAAPLPVDQDVLEQIRAQVGPRPVWVASSTHAGEEEVVLAAHRALLATHPDLLLVLVPRHPERGDAVAALLDAGAFVTARRTQDQAIGADTQVYLADTLGETGTWYALAPLVFLGGSLQEIGGHNPFEPAQSGAAVLTGPHVANFAEIYGDLLDCGGAVQVRDEASLAAAAARWLEDGAALTRARAAAAGFAAAQRGALDQVCDRLIEALDLETGHG